LSCSWGPLQAAKFFLVGFICLVSKSIVTQIKNKVAIYYAVGIALFSAIAVALIKIVIIVDHNS